MGLEDEFKEGDCVKLTDDGGEKDASDLDPNTIYTTGNQYHVGGHAEVDMVPVYDGSVCDQNYKGDYHPWCFQKVASQEKK